MSRVTPAVAQAVFARDQGCIAPRLGGTVMECFGRDRLEHVQADYGRMGRRAPSDAAHLVVLCEGHTEPGMRGGYVWATDKANRERCREYLLMMTARREAWELDDLDERASGKFV